MDADCDHDRAGNDGDPPVSWADPWVFLTLLVVGFAAISLICAALGLGSPFLDSKPMGGGHPPVRRTTSISA